MKRVIIAVIVGLLLLTVWSLLAFDLLRFSREQALDFADCLASGGKIGNTIPRRCEDLSGKVFEESLGNSAEKSDLIQLFEPAINATIASSTLTFSGEAKGFWFVNPSFPVILRAVESGQTLASGRATSEGNWLDTDFVKFSGKLHFKVSTTTLAELVLKSENNTGLNSDNELIVPIILETK